ncbi:hypothetical protein FRB94_005799 [Tulasnella sp. JGI-2019a]|nr:hypothetical protein FRB94_005799 [Tulasnella sp. JGI-2019a]
MAVQPPAYTFEAPGGVDVPPGYDGAGTAETFIMPSPLDRDLPPTFRINKSHVSPLVQPSDLQAHLILLGTFHRLREQVRTQKGPRDFELTPEETWAVFLERAVHRFQCWASRMIRNDGDGDITLDVPAARSLTADECPPIDVLMVWHTYMLSPRTYYEDCIRMHRSLQQVGSFPLLQMSATIDAETLIPHPPTESRSTAFRSNTGELFEPPIATTPGDTVPVSCPRCSIVLSIPWLSPDGRGYAQRGFIVQCDVEGGCQMVFDREVLGVRKFYEDKKKCVKKPTKHCLANTLVDYHTGVPMPDLARELTGIVLKLNVGTGPTLQRPEYYGMQYGWKFKHIEHLCRDGFLSKNLGWNVTPRTLNVILAPYRHAGLCSMDLPSAVLRQMSFIDKMVNLGWTEDGRFEEDIDTLTRCVVRYHAFLDLMASTPSKFTVPTLDIDLAWHTHQLLCASYRTLRDIIGIIPDHDDKVTQGALSTAFDDTAKAWKARFAIPYSVCGCPPPVKANPAITVISAFSRKGKGKAVPDGITNPRPDLISVELINADETHPSDHNSVALINPRNEMEQAQRRRQELKKRGKELHRAAARGKEGEWAGLIAKRGAEHTPAFLRPVEYGIKEPFGVVGHGDCTAYSGGAVKGDFAAGECVKGHGSLGMCGTSSTVPRNGLRQSIQHAMIMTGDKHKMIDYGVAPGTGVTGAYIGFGGCGGTGCGGGGCGGGGG